MVELATTDDVHRVVIGFDSFDNKSKETWITFLRQLKNCGLSGLKMFTSYAHDGIIYAISQIFPAFHGNNVKHTFHAT